ncbi:MAG TPA: hypothetical protein ENI27_00185, partial [bacterium]|nr:hypothetical protein [bacterium]
SSNGTAENLWDEIQELETRLSQEISTAVAVARTADHEVDPQIKKLRTQLAEMKTGLEAQKARLVELEAEVQPLQVQEVADDMSLLAVRIIKASLFMGVGCAFLGGVLSDFSYLGPIIGACIGVVLGAASEYRFAHRDKA